MMWAAWILLGFVVLAVVGCATQVRLTDEDLDGLADRMAGRPPNPEAIELTVDRILNHPNYIAWSQSDEFIQKFTNALLAHPSRTPEQDCATVIPMASVASGKELPPESESDRLCDWWKEQAGLES